MSRLRDYLVRREPWSGLIMGNHALARAMIETGTRVITSYPGSPTPEIGAALLTVPEEERPYHFEFATNEKVALEIAAGGSLNGNLSTVFFKSVGLNVAADSLIQLGLLEMIGGMVVILGDDPGANSSQNEQDNRHFARMSYLPLLEPASPREAYEMYREAARLSVEHRMPVFLRMTTHVCHAREVVAFAGLPEEAPPWRVDFAAANGPYVPIASTVFPLKRRALAKLEAFAEVADRSELNAVLIPPGEPPAGERSLGLLSAGLPAFSLLENLATTGTSLPLLKLGLSHPLPRERILAFLREHDEVLLVEELDRVLETEIKALAYEGDVKCVLRSRRDPEDRMGELDPLRTHRLLAATWPDAFPPPPEAPPLSEVAPRAPQMCPGCGHRSAFHAVKRALSAQDITVADIGCHSMGFLPPYEMGEVLFSMGHSTSTASGLALHNEQRKVLAFLGDSTLMHAGLPGIVNAVLRDSDVTLVLLDNGTTAMTGHQPRAGTGETGPRIALPAVLEALGVTFLRDVDAYDQPKLTAHVKEALAHPGFAVVIARHPCMLQFARKQRRKKPDWQPVQVRVDPEKCDRIHTCTADFCCPSFVRHEDDSVTVHPELCIGDGSCLQVCPVSALERPPKGGAS